MDAAAPLGERIAFHRRRRGLSQVKLAGLLGRSESWISQVERGVRPVDRISVLNEVARALSVPVKELAPTALGSLEEAEEHPAVRAVRAALTTYEPMLGKKTERPVPDLSLLEDDAAQAWDLVQASRYEELATRLPRLLADAQAAARSADATTARVGLIVAAGAYQAAAAMLVKLGERDMAWLAGDRAVQLGERGNDPALAAAGIVRIGHAFLSDDRLDDAVRVASQAAAGLEERSADSAEAMSVIGALHLIAAIAATRLNQIDGARDHLAAAEGAAQRLGEDRNDFHTEFGPTNVAIHAVAIAVESGDAGEALRRAAKIDASQLSPERRARFLIDVARAYGQRRKTEDAVRTLREAERLTPEQVRTNELVREMVRDLLRTGRRQPDKTVRELARRIGVIP